MYSTCKRIGSSIIPFLGLWAWTALASPAIADGAARGLPDCYDPGVMLNVSITIEAPPGTIIVGAEDWPPAGWTVGFISDNGNYDPENHKVKWYFGEPCSRTVTYELTPPQGAMGQQCFEGIVSFNGFDQAIAGDDCVDTCALIPTLSEWGVVGMTLLLLTAGTLVFMRRRPAQA